MNQQVDRQTGEIVPVMDGAPAPVALGAMRDMLVYVEQFCKEILKDKEDYDLIPGTKRPSLLQPGAEKICFAFGLSPKMTTLCRSEEPERKWQYTTTTKNGETTERTAVGYFRYEVLCELVHRNSNTVWGAQIGVCESSERGRETAPANTIIKMAQKRAFVGAAKSAAFLSGRFTCDVEDLRGDQAPDTGRQVKSGHRIEATTDNSYPNAKCNFCGKNHIAVGAPIVKVKGKWGSEACLDKPKDPQEPVDGKGRTYFEQAEAGEAAYLAMFPKENHQELQEELDKVKMGYDGIPGILRAKVGGEPCAEIRMATPATVKAYVEWLAATIESTRKQQEG
jgi:hypothetical protein